MTFQRMLPIITDLNRHFWQGGQDGVLKILRCQDCKTYIHVPQPRCTNCMSEALAPEAVSGKGVVETFTINRKPWGKDMPVPFNIAIVGLPEQEGLRVTTNIKGVAVEDLYCGMKVRVEFEQDEDVWVPLFVPDEG